MKIMYKGKSYQQDLLGYVLDFSNLIANSYTLPCYKYWRSDKNFRFSGGTVMYKGNKLDVVAQTEDYYIVSNQNLLMEGQIAVLKADVTRLGGVLTTS